MASDVAPKACGEQITQSEDAGRKAGHLLAGGMEALVLVLICLAPWAFGAVEPVFSQENLHGCNATQSDKRNRPT